MHKKLTKEEFIKNAIEIHGNKYDYSEVEYINSTTKVKIYCKSCKQFFYQRPHSHLNGYGCSKCGRKKFIEKMSDTTENFIEKAKNVHGDKYDYSQVVYINRHSKVKIYCKNCKKYFWQFAYNHLHGEGCEKCGKQSTNKKLALKSDEFLKRAIKIHGNKYEYDLSNYIDGTHKIKIKCNECGQIFEQPPLSHLTGRGCRHCANIKKGLKLKNNLYNLIKELQKRGYGNRFNFSKAIYNTATSKLTVICKKCGYEFKITPHSLLAGSNCPHCNKLKPRYNSLTTEKFIEKAIKVHGDSYDYSEVNYTGYCNKIRIYCKECKKFFIQTPATHLNGSGCPFCTMSKGEKEINNILLKNNIKFIRQKRFKECRDKKPLPFDFYLLDYNICIEFQGKQHYIEGLTFYEAINKNDVIIANKEFLKQQKHDQIKRDYCMTNNIKLVEIRYDENIEEKINDLMNNILAVNINNIN